MTAVATSYVAHYHAVDVDLRTDTQHAHTECLCNGTVSVCLSVCPLTAAVTYGRFAAELQEISIDSGSDGCSPAAVTQHGTKQQMLTVLVLVLEVEVS